MMKALQSLLIAATFWFSGIASAFDTDKPPPKWTLTNTYHFLDETIFSNTFLSGADALEMLGFMRYYLPPSYTPEMKLDEVLYDPDIKFSIELKDKSMADVLLIIAERLKADVIIRPGCIQLVQRKAER